MMKPQFSTVLMLIAFAPIMGYAKAAPTYDSLHPYYAEFCAVTQLTPIEGEGGGIGGHGVMFLKGVCRDVSQGYPRLKVCDPKSIDLKNPESGVSISVDKMFKNANWVASDGKDFIMTGGVRANKPVSEASEDAVVKKILSQRLLGGIQVHEQYLESKPATMSSEEFVARSAISTDFALNFGRNVLCARMPIQAKMLPAMVQYLNQRNDEYRGEKVYNWSGIYNNCAHTTRNAFAASGIMRKLKTDQFAPLQLFNLAVPSNQFLDLMRLGNDTSLRDVVGFYNDKYKRQMLVENDWMAVQPGVLTEIVMAHGFENSRYNTGKSGFILQDMPVLNIKKRQLETILKDARYSDIRTNLLMFQAKYQDALEKKISIERLREDANANGKGELDGPEFAAFYAKYYSHLERALSEVQAQL